MTHMTDDDILAMIEAATPGAWRYMFESVDPEWAIVTTSGGAVIANVNDRHTQTANARLIAAAPDLAAECLARGARIAELEAQAEYDHDFIVGICVALLKAQEAMIPTETLERWADQSEAGVDYRITREIRTAIAQRENRNE